MKKPRQHAATPPPPGRPALPAMEAEPLCGGLIYVERGDRLTYDRPRVLCRGCLQRIRKRPQIAAAMRLALSAEAVSA